MPAWVLLISESSVRAANIEQEIRLGGFSPRRAPDLDRARVLLNRSEPPAAVVVDLAGSGAGPLHGLAQAAGGAPVVALLDDPEAEVPAELAGARAATVSGAPGSGELARRLSSLADG